MQALVFVTQPVEREEERHEVLGVPPLAVAADPLKAPLLTLLRLLESVELGPSFLLGGLGRGELPGGSLKSGLGGGLALPLLPALSSAHQFPHLALIARLETRDKRTGFGVSRPGGLAPLLRPGECDPLDSTASLEVPQARFAGVPDVALAREPLEPAPLTRQLLSSLDVSTATTVKVVREVLREIAIGRRPTHRHR